MPAKRPSSHPTNSSKKKAKQHIPSEDEDEKDSQSSKQDQSDDNNNNNHEDEKTRMIWSNYPLTANIVDTAALQGDEVFKQSSPEFIALYKKATKAFKSEGGTGILSKKSMAYRMNNVKFHKIRKSEHLTRFSPARNTERRGTERYTSSVRGTSLAMDDDEWENEVFTAGIPHEPVLRLLEPDEVIDFNPMRQATVTIEDKVQRNMHTIEHLRRQLMQVTNERDYLQQHVTATQGWFRLMTGYGTSSSPFPSFPPIQASSDAPFPALASQPSMPPLQSSTMQRLNHPFPASAMSPSAAVPSAVQKPQPGVSPSQIPSVHPANIRTMSTQAVLQGSEGNTSNISSTSTEINVNVDTSGNMSGVENVDGVAEKTVESSNFHETAITKGSYSRDESLDTTIEAAKKGGGEVTNPNSMHLDAESHVHDDSRDVGVHDEKPQLVHEETGAGHSDPTLSGTPAFTLFKDLMKEPEATDSALDEQVKAYDAETAHLFDEQKGEFEDVDMQDDELDKIL